MQVRLGKSKKVLLSIVLAVSPGLQSTDVQPTAAAGILQQPGFKQPSYQLPRAAVPEHYDLTFTPDLSQFTFSGNASIDIVLTEPSQSIVLNALDLKVKEATIQSRSGDALKKPGIAVLDSDKETLTLNFNEALAKGSYRLNLVFEGRLNGELRGFYRSGFTDEDGQWRWMATTQMEPTDARRMFPCFDEPEMKATFQVTAVIPPDMTAISNGAVISQTVDQSDKRKIVRFDTSPKMSTYLVALVVGPLKSTETRLVNGVPVTVWSAAGKEHLGKYALDTAAQVLRYQTAYFGIDYPAQKLDLIAVPDFRSSAMENFGAITFREAALLVDDQTGSSFLKRRVANVIAHEIAHQWFGDLVTMRWWDDLWLNEAFASWMATKTVNEIHPDWQELTRGILTRNESMNIDQLKTTRAIHAHVENPKQAAEMFDPITYDKGEAVLRMIENFVGETALRDGIRDYLNSHKFSNATSEELWRAIGSRSNGLPVPAVMTSWILQPGFPLLTAGRDQQGKLTLRQERFFGMMSADADNTSQLWDIPVAIRFPGEASEGQVCKLVSQRQEEIEMPAHTASVFLNAGGNGFYRSAYAEADRLALLNRFELLTPEERLSFIDDTRALVWNGSLPIEAQFALLSKIPTERDPVVLKELIELLAQVETFVDESTREPYAKLVRRILGPVKQDVGWQEQPSEKEAVKEVRNLALTLLGTNGQDKSTIEEARALYRKFMQKRSAIAGDIAPAVLSVVAYNGDTPEYEEIKQAWKAERIPELEKLFLYQLGRFNRSDLADSTLQLLIGPDVRAQDGFRVLAEMLKRDRTKLPAWKFVQSNWAKIADKYPPRSLNLIASACYTLDRPRDEAEVVEFFRANQLPYGKAEVARMLERLRCGVLFRERNEQKVREWIRQHCSV